MSDEIHSLILSHLADLNTDFIADELMRLNDASVQLDLMLLLLLLLHLKLMASGINIYSVFQISEIINCDI